MPEAIDAGSPEVVVSGGRSSRLRTFRLIQVLRAVAALMVVAHHATILLEQRLHLSGFFWAGGAAGVDLFFVISGLVMTLSVQRLERSARGAWTFLKRRIERVVPPYWIATTAKVLLALALPALAVNAIGTPWHVLASYLFLPSLGPTHVMEPVLVVGWTLELEMMFYLLIAASLVLRTSPWWTVVPVFLLLSCARLGTMAPDSKLLVWSSAINFEFVWGMALGVCTMRKRFLAPWLSVVVGLSGVVLLVMPWSFPEGWRPVIWGLPAAAIVSGALGLERHLGEAVPALLQKLGDASYSIYLTHGFVLPLLGVEWLHVAGSPAGTRWTLLTLALLASSGVGLGCYQWMELPMLRWFHLRRGAAAQG